MLEPNNERLPLVSQLKLMPAFDKAVREFLITGEPQYAKEVIDEAMKGNDESLKKAAGFICNEIMKKGGKHPHFRENALLSRKFSDWAVKELDKRGIPEVELHAKPSQKPPSPKA